MKLLGRHIITSPLLSCLKTTSICSHQLKKVAVDMGARYELEQLRRGPEIWRGKPGRV